MLVQMKDFVEGRRSEGMHWPSRELIYSWRFHNYMGFNDRCVKTLGRKLLIDTEGFAQWLTTATKDGHNG